MTLSRFLRDYLYIQIGGSRHGPIRRYANLLATMLLGGLWHGAGWTFVIWGGLHGIYLVINHGWIALNSRGVLGLPSLGRLGPFLAGLLTFVSVVIAWVFFRATSLDAAFRVLSGMFGLNSIVVPPIPGLDLVTVLGLQSNPDMEIDWRQIGWIGSLLSFAWLLPNSQQIVKRWIAAPRGAEHCQPPAPALGICWHVALDTAAADRHQRFPRRLRIHLFQFLTCFADFTHFCS